MDKQIALFLEDIALTHGDLIAIVLSLRALVIACVPAAEKLALSGRGVLYAFGQIAKELP